MISKVGLGIMENGHHTREFLRKMGSTFHIGNYLVNNFSQSLPGYGGSD